jgi:hypothetical protein
MKNKLKGKMVKTQRPKVNVVEQVICECLSCDWEGSIDTTKTDKSGQMLCPLCKDKVIIFEN